MLPSFLHVLVVSTHVHDDVFLIAMGRTSPTRLGLSSSRASPMPVCASSSRWCSASLAVGRATVDGNGAPRRHAGLTSGGARCQKIGIVDGPPRRAGQYAGHVRSCPEMMFSGVFIELNCGRSAIGERTVRRRVRNLSRDDVVSGGFRRVELRAIRYWRADSPP